MTERIIGESGSRRRRWTLLLPLVAALALGLFYITGAQAVHNVGNFELDADAVASADPGDDWDILQANTGGSALAFTFVTDGVEGDNPDTTAVETSEDDVYATNSKDIQNISAWKYKYQFPEDKNDIEHAYAAAYSGPDTAFDADSLPDLFLYFGIDRMANNGSADLGMWFLQDDVSEPVPPPASGNHSFSGSHTSGDILVQTDFTTGGTIERIDVYMWDADGFGYSGAKTLVGGDLWRIFSGQDCDLSTGPDKACGNVNTEPETAPWDYSYKCVGSNQPPGSPPAGCDGASGVTPLDNFPKATFFEGGVNLSAFGLTDVCLATIIANSRSSASETSTLDDKALGGFNLCGALRILKNSAKGGPVSAAGATFTISPDPTDGSGVLTIVDNVAPPTGFDEDPDIGELCISSIPPDSYTVDETVAPAGYGLPTSNDPQTADVNAGTSCSSGATVFTFVDPPLYDLQVNFNDKGSGETSATIDCPAVEPPDSTTPPAGWDSSETYLNQSAPQTVICTIVVDP